MLMNTRFAAVTVVVAILFVAGCASNRPEQVPATATVVAEGDRRLTFEAPADGRVYVWDSDRDRLIYTGNINRNQVLSIDPEHDRVMLDSLPATEHDLDRGNRLQIYYLRESDFDRDRYERRRERYDRYDR